MKKLLIAALAVTLAFGACKDDKDDATPSTPGQTGSAALTGKDWRMTANTMTISGTGTPLDGTTDNYAAMEACEKDNLSRFNDDKTIVEKEGATKCDEADPDTTPQGTWELMDNNTKLKITPPASGSDAITYDVTTLNETTLSFSNTSSDDGVTMVVKVTFVKN